MRRIAWVLLFAAAAACNQKTATRAHGLIRVDPVAVDFGPHPTGTGATANVTVSNDGTVALSISRVVIQSDARGAFSLGETPAAIAAGASATIAVTYTAPATEGADGATLSIDSDADNAPETNVSLSARAVTACTPKSCQDLGFDCGPTTDGCGHPLDCGNCSGSTVCRANSCCTPETDSAFCSRLGKDCGTVSDTDNCGSTRTVVSCGTCTGTGESCGGADAGNVCGCTAESDPAFCTRLGKNCGSVTAGDNCGNSRTVQSCGTCSGTDSCGGAGTPNVCGCAAETDQALCATLGKDCGSLQTTDNCGAARTVSSCGSCTGSQTCGGGGTANVCGCASETDAQFCARLGADCGSVTANDNCGTSRTVASCGSCTLPNSCGGAGVQNVCGATAPGCPADAGVADGGAINFGAPVTLPMGGFAQTQAESINAAGQIVGYAVPGSQEVAAYWSSPSAAPVALNVTGFSAPPEARSINDFGQIVGVAGPPYQALYWASPASAPVQLAGGNNPGAIGINNRGEIVGTYNSGAPLAIYWSSPTANPTQLPMGSYTNTIAWGISDSGQISGSGWAGANQVPIYWPSPSSAPVAIPSGGYGPNVAAFGINAFGQMVGNVTGGASPVALYWSGVAQSPAALPTGTFGSAYAIGLNACGLAVGFSYSGPQQALLWSSCAAETDAQFCARLAKNCGTVTANDNCGVARTVASCGSCTNPQTCGGSGTANVCGGPCWSTLPNAPTAHLGGGLAAANGKLYLVGGNSAGNEAYDPGTNSWAAKANLPTPRAYASVAAIGTKLYVVGGCAGSDCRVGVTGTNEIYDTVANSWSTGAPMPTPRYNIATGVIGGKLYAVSGQTACPPCSGTSAVEVYDPATDTWTSKAADPAPRESAGATGFAGQLFMFGGYGYGGSGLLSRNDEYDPLTDGWTSSIALPAANAAQGGAAAGARVYAMSGDNTTTAAMFDPFAGTWANLAAVPNARYAATAASLNGAIYVSGATPGNVASSTVDAYVCAAAGPAWVPLVPTGTPPPSRTYASAAYNPSSNRMIVFGGQQCGVPTFNDVWVLSNANGLGGTPGWTKLSPSGTAPSGRFGSASGYDVANNRLIVFGGEQNGCTSNAVVNDVFVLSNADGTGGTPAWAPLSPSGTAPSARMLTAGVYDPAQNRLIVFAGNPASGNCNGSVNDVWVLSNANGLGGAPAWSPLSPAGGPPAARDRHSFVWDPTTSRAIAAFGGQECGAADGDVWRLDPGASTWTQHTGAVGVPPAPRAAAAAIYDSATNRLVVPFGVASSFFDEVWVLSGANGTGTSTWTQLPLSGATPSPRYGHTTVYDAAHKRMIIFGGTNSAGLLGDVWVLTDADGS